MTSFSIFTLCLAIITWFGYLNVDKYNQNIEISNYVNTVNNIKSSDYYGYIKFPGYNLERLIKKGPADKVIEEGYIGIYGYDYESNIINPLILVGHSRSNLFSVLHQLTKNDLIEINIGGNVYKYRVKKIRIINVDDYNSLNNIKNKQLGLITCLEDNSKRLLIISDQY